MRIHPGDTVRRDAQPKYFTSSATEHVAAASLQWTQLPSSGVFTEREAAMVPQGDRMGRRAAWDHLAPLRLPEHRDLSASFPWWLWLANLDAEIIGSGVTSAQLRQSWKRARIAGQDHESVIVAFARTDGTSCSVTLNRKGNGQFKVNVSEDP